MKKTVLSFLLSLILLTVVSAGNAVAYSYIATFGDSLSDNGNIGRYTDGTLWVENLANAESALLADIAFAGATTGYDNPAAGLSYTGLLWQVAIATDPAGFLATLPLADTLFTVWAGANDLLQGRSLLDAANNMGTALEALYNDGARDFVVLNLPNVGSTPLVSSLGTTASSAATAWTTAYNSALQSVVDNFLLSYSDLTLYYIDVFSIFEQYQVGTQAWLDLFWTDGFHPSSTGHQLISDAVVQAMGIEVPEPGTMLLFATGLCSLGSLAGIGRRGGMRRIAGMGGKE